jgi:hypothetical protein
LPIKKLKHEKVLEVRRAALLWRLKAFDTFSTFSKLLGLEEAEMSRDVTAIPSDLSHSVPPWRAPKSDRGTRSL